MKGALHLKLNLHAIMPKIVQKYYLTMIAVITCYTSNGQNVPYIEADSTRMYNVIEKDAKGLHRLQGGPFSLSERSIGLVPEIQGTKNLFLGLGLSRANFYYGEGGGNGFGTTLSVEYNPFCKIIAPKLNVWANGHIFFLGGNIGLNGIYYITQDKSNFVLRPEIGLGFIKVFLNYGYQLFLDNNIAGLNKHTLTLSYYHTIYPSK